jgi:hypothetical protein
MKPVAQLFKAIANGDKKAADNAFKDTMSQKIKMALETRKVALGNTFLFKE